MPHKSPPRPQHYYYAHAVLKNYMFDDLRSQFFLNSDMFRNILVNSIWYRMNNSGPESEPYLYDEENAFPSELEILGENRYLFVVTPPPPLGTSEAYFVGVYAELNPSYNPQTETGIFNTLPPSKIRYFTLEYHDEDRACFCEWTETKHGLIGFTEDKSLVGFVARIRGML